MAKTPSGCPWPPQTTTPKLANRTGPPHWPERGAGGSGHKRTAVSLGFQWPGYASVLKQSCCGQAGLLWLGMVPMEGLEPPCPCGHQILSLARLPIPPHRQPTAQEHSRPTGVVNCFSIRALQQPAADAVTIRQVLPKLRRAEGRRTQDGCSPKPPQNLGAKQATSPPVHLPPHGRGVHPRPLRPRPPLGLALTSVQTGRGPARAGQGADGRGSSAGASGGGLPDGGLGSLGCSWLGHTHRWANRGCPAAPFPRFGNILFESNRRLPAMTKPACFLPDFLMH